MKRFFLLGILLSSLTLNTVHARPKIGLVLGGGGAAGVSHVGVLKVLEEHNIPIDVIAGNSMGAIVGSLYASGMSVDDIEKTARTLDWMSLFNDGQAFQEKDFQKKKQDAGFFTSAELGVGAGGVKLPSGLISGQRLTFELRRLLSPVQHIGNFDQLPIPFRAVATDINTGKTVVLKSGNLATAVRASMSIPSLFSPVTINGRVLVDGLVSNNLPVDVAQQMGADILIVSRIPPSKEKPVKSAIDIALRSMDLLMAQTTDAQVERLRSQDILIIPQTEDIGNLDFDRVRETIPLGVKGAKQQTVALKKLAQKIHASTAKKIVKSPPDKKVHIAKIIIKNGSKLKDKLLRKQLGIKAGEILDFDHLQQGLNNIHGLGYFSLVDYHLTPTPDGKQVLTIDARAAEEGNQRLRFGFSLADDFNGDSEYQAGVQYIKKGLTDQGTELRASAIIGENLKAQLELHHPLYDGNESFVEPKLFVQERDFTVIENGQDVAEIRAKKTGIHLDTGRSFGQWGEVRAGVFYEKLSPELKTGSIALPDVEPVYAGLKIQHSINTLDSINFPTQGGRLTTQYTRDMKALGSAEEFDTIKVEGEKVWSRDKHRFIANGQIAAAFNDKDTIRLVEPLSIGHTGRLSGVEEENEVGNYMVSASMGYMREIAHIPKFARVHVGGAVGWGNTWQERKNVDVDDLKTSASVFVGAETPIGPVFIGYRKQEDDEPSPYFTFGRSF